MGYMQLQDFETDLQSALGDRGITNPRLDRWINFGYLDLIGAIQFPEVTAEDTSQSTAGATNSVNVPTGAMVVTLVRNTTSDKLLGWVPLAEYWRLSQASTGSPIKWTRQTSKIYLHPVPTGIEALKIVYIKTPTRLTGATDVSVLTDTWDAAIHLLSVHHALLALGEEDRAMVWMQKAASYINSRMTEEGLEYTTPGLQLSLPIVKEKMVGEQMGGGGK